MEAELERFVSSLLYEGYALYPYTPEATKNATPTPFGIVYPPRYAEECAGAHDHARLECLAVPIAPDGLDGSVGPLGPEPDVDDLSRRPALTATLRWLSPDGNRHSTERRAELGPLALNSAGRLSIEIPEGRFTVRVDPPRVDGCVRVRACVHNTVSVDPGLDRAGALAHALLSVHVIVELTGGRFVSPLEAGLSSENIWPVLAGGADHAVLGAGIVLPDHPALAPASYGNLFDNTEIEEALVLHVHALTDAEKSAALASDRVVGDMLERALALGPQEIMALHSGLTESGAIADSIPPLAAFADPDPDPDIKGEQAITVDGVSFARNDTIVLRPGVDRDPYDRMLDGRRATIERIYIDSDDRVQLAVTIDDDPGQQLLRESGRFLFFFAHEVALP